MSACSCGATDAAGCAYPEFAADPALRPQDCVGPPPVDAKPTATPQTTAPAAPGRRVRSVVASTVTAERVEWLLPDRVPLGAVTLLMGMPGLGKSTWAMGLAARLTRGELPCGPAAALYVSYEDAWSFSLRPRFEAAGANLDLVHFLDVVDRGHEAAVEVPLDVDALGERVRETGARFVGVDPLAGAVPVELSMYKDQHVRRALAPLAKMAEQTGCAVIAIVHSNKAPGADAMMRTGGSIGIIGAARSGLSFAADPDDDDHRLLGHYKTNVGPRATTLRLRMETRPVAVNGGREFFPVLVDAGESDHDGRTLLGLGRDDDDAEPGARELAREFLLEQLYATSVRVADLKQAAEAHGLAWRTVVRAKEALGIEPQKGGFREGWKWALPLSHEGCQAPWRPSDADELGTLRGNGMDTGVEARSDTPEAPKDANRMSMGSFGENGAESEAKLPGDDGYLEWLWPRFERELITPEEWRQLDRAHRLIVGLAT